jgi:uncharacterized protein (TIGR02145 family)/uncharacterized repeat protein (TIGR02543 family)
MKKFYVLLTAIFMSLSLLAQAPSGINYQTVIRDGAGNILPDAEISLQMTIRTGAPDGAVVYQENHAVTTNAFGLVNLVIGSGAVQSGSFAEIDWGANAHYLETAVEFSGSKAFQIMGVTQFLSVPYALQAKQAEKLILTDPDGNRFELVVDNMGNVSAIPLDWICGHPYTDTRDGKVYQTVQIGWQCWMAENLAFLPSVSPPTQGSVSNPHYYVYDYDGTNVSEAKSTENFQTYGVLYNWPSALTSCPEGWYLPIDNEWKVLEGTVDSQYGVGDPIWNNSGLRGFDVGKNLKSDSGWSNNGNGNDEYGFSALPGGSLWLQEGSFMQKLDAGQWWTSTQDGNIVIIRGLLTNQDQSWLTGSNPGNARSVRCLKGDSPSPGSYLLILEPNPDFAGEVSGFGFYDFGSQVNLTATAFNGWQFVNWTDSDSIVSEVPSFTYTMPANNITLIANFIVDQSSFNCGAPLIDARDGQSYSTVQIGDQCWMAENLNIGTMIPISQDQQNINLIEKYCFNNSEEHCDLYGGLYQWAAMFLSNNPTPGAQGICPDGWYLPKVSDMSELTSFINTQSGFLCNNNTDFIAKALSSKSNWDYSSNTCAVGNNPVLNNASGFNALPAGTAVKSEFGFWFNPIGIHSKLWTSNSKDAFDSYTLFFGFDNPDVYIYPSFVYGGLPVRCIKENNSAPQKFNLHLNVDPSGAGITYGIGQYEAGEPVNITAEANPGWEFVNWTDDDGIVSEAANFTYTMPAADVTLTANFSEITLIIGDFYQGGIIAYILQPDDPGYVEGETHGLIAAPSDQSTGAQWGCGGTFIGGTSTALGTGAANTAAIVAGCSLAGIAARICNDLELNGYSDWYLPSKDELNKLYINRAAIGGFASNFYTSSSEYDNLFAWVQAFYDGHQNPFNKNDDYYHVRAVRAFSCDQQNLPPASPSNPIPENESTGQSIETNLSWTCTDPESDPLTYDVYFGTEATPAQVATGQSETTFDPGTLEYNTQYFWQIVAHDDKGNTTEGEVWSFTTEEENLPPAAPANPNPENEAIDQPIETQLSWTCTDPENDPITYDVYFGTEATPALVATGQSETTFNPGTLDYNTQYFWKIVAHDGQGNITEGEVWSFTTESQSSTFNCGDDFTDARDGQTYSTVQIGDQCWMAENLNIGTRINGSNNQTNNGIIEKYCYNNAEAQCDVYGGLYQWNEMMNFTTTPGVQGICPEGWHLPTDAEWTAFTTYVSDQPAFLCNSTASFIAKSLAAKTNWSISTNICAVGNNIDLNNATNFTALPGGNRSTSGSFIYQNYYGYWWSSSANSTSNAWHISLYSNVADVTRVSNNKSAGFSVRCLKD